MSFQTFFSGVGGGGVRVVGSVAPSFDGDSLQGGGGGGGGGGSEAPFGGALFGGGPWACAQSAMP